jgi:hypothetical protein
MFKRKAKYDYQGLFNPSKLDKFNIDRLSTRLVPRIKYFNWLVKNFPNLYAYQLVIQANL